MNADHVAVLHDAIKTLRDRGEVVSLVDGFGLYALWDVGRYRKLGYYAVVRMSRGLSP